MNKIHSKFFACVLSMLMTIGVSVGISSKHTMNAAKAETSATLTLNGTNNKGPWSTSYGSSTGSTTVASNGAIIDLSYTNVATMSSSIQVKAGTSNGFYSTSTLENCYISSINVTVKTNTATLSVSEDGNSWTKVTYTSGTALVFSEGNGYEFFKLNATSKYTQITSVVVSYSNYTTSSTNWIFDSITVETEPTRKTYFEGDTEVDYTGAVVKANYYAEDNSANKKSVQIANDDENLVWSLDLKNNKVNVSYTENGITRTDSFDVTNGGLGGLMTTFTDTLGTVTGSNDVVSYKAEKGTAGTAPALNGGEIRVYQNGGLFTVTAASGYVLTSVTIGSSMATTVTYSIDGGAHTTENTSISADSTFLLDSLNCSSVQYKCTGTSSSSRLYVNYLAVTYAVKEDIVPTKVEASFATGKGTYYNVDESKSIFSTTDIVVRTVNDNGDIAELFNAGIGFKITINGTTLDATTEVQTLNMTSFEGGDYPASITVGELTNSNAITIKVTQKEVVGYEWTNEPKVEFYSHIDTLTFGGKLKVTFNNGAYNTSEELFDYAIHEYNELNENKLGEVVEISTHSDGTINVESETRYVLEKWHKDFPSDLHCYKEFVVKIPTIEITDNYTGKYFVGVKRDLDVNVTLKTGDTVVRTLSSEEYTLSHTSVTPSSTDPINVTASWVIDGVSVLTSNTLTINPEVSTRELGKLAISDQTFTAGSYFTNLKDGICLEITSTSDIEEVSEEHVTFTVNGKTIDSSTRLLKSHSGTVTATYSEGEGESLNTSCTFNLTVTDALISLYTEPTYGDYVKVTALDEITNGNYLVVAHVGETVYVMYDKDANDNFGSVSETGSTIANTAEVSKYSVDIVRTSDSTITMQANASAPNNNGKYYGSEKGSNSLTFNDTPVSLGLSAATGRNANDTGSWDIIGSSTKLSFNTTSGTSRFRFYKNATASGDSYLSVDLYKLEVNDGVGNAVDYLKSVIDAYRLNNGDTLSICNVQTNIYSSEDWTKAKEVFSKLSASQLNELNVQDYFGEVGKTYVDTYNELINKEPNSVSSNGLIKIFNSSNSNELFILLAALISISVVATFVIYKKIKLNINK